MATLSSSLTSQRKQLVDEAKTTMDEARIAEIRDEIGVIDQSLTAVQERLGVLGGVKQTKQPSAPVDYNSRYGLTPRPTK